jgi:hypothetical protein
MNTHFFCTHINWVYNKRWEPTCIKCGHVIGGVCLECCYEESKL